MGPITLRGDYLPRLEPLLINSCAEFLSCLPEFEVPILAPCLFFYRATGKLGCRQRYGWNVPYGANIQNNLRMLNKAVQQGPSRRRGEAYAPVR